MGSNSFTSLRGDREDNGCNPRLRSSSLAAQSGHNFSLPRSKTIIEVNIDTFERKPWRHPGADITDFFNFGFDEDSWKRYCNNMDQYRHATIMSTRVPASKSCKLNEAYEAGSQHETVAQEAVADNSQSRNGRIVSSTSKSPCREHKYSEMRKGRAIQVEDSIGERQPSADVRRLRDRDSDVVIQITVQDSNEDSSGSVKEGLDNIDGSEQEASENGDLGDGRDILCFSSSSEAELHRECLYGHHEGLDTPISKRCSQSTNSCKPVSMDSGNHGSVQISDVDGHLLQEVAVIDSEGTAEAIEISNNTKEKVDRDACNTAPSILGTESYQGKQTQCSPSSSCSGSHCEVFRDGAYINIGKSLNHIKRPSLNSVTDLRKSNTSKSYGVKTKRSDCKYYARHRSPTQEDLKHHKRRLHGVSGSKTHLYDEAASPITDTGELYNVHHLAVGNSRQNERLHDVDSYHGEDFSYSKESELSFNYYGERFSDYQVGAGSTKNHHRKGNQRFGVETNQYFNRNLDEGEYFLEQRRAKVDDEVMAREWYHYESGLSVEDMGSLTWQESRQLNLKYSYLNNKRGARWKRKGDELRFRKRMKNDGFFLNRKFANDITREKYRRPVPYNNRGGDYLEHEYEGCIPYARREDKMPGRSKRRCGSPSIDLDNFWSMGDEDELRRCGDHRSLSSHTYKEPHTANSSRWHGTMSPRNDVYERHGRHWRCRRQVRNERSRDGGWVGAYTDAFDRDREESINNPKDRVHFGRRHCWQSELLHCTEDESISKHWDGKFHAQIASFSFERSSGHKRFDAEHGSDHVGKLIEDREGEGCRSKLIREGNSGNRFDSSYHEQTLPRCGNSVDWHGVVVERKSSGRCSKAGTVVYNGRLENKDQNIDVEQKTLKDFDESHTEKVVRYDNPKVEISQNNENEALDIEEGQIITEEINENATENIRQSDDAAISDVEEFRSENVTNGNTAIEGYDNPRILEVIAKMEKRRERFKEPITLKTESDNALNTLVDSLDEPSETKQQRPVRKRRWGGS